MVIKVVVLYSDNEFFGELVRNLYLTRDIASIHCKIGVTHHQVGEYELFSETELTNDQILGDAFMRYNQDPSPIEGIEKMKIHTSMSVGDIVKINDVYHMCDITGWFPIECESCVEAKKEI